MDCTLCQKSKYDSTTLCGNGEENGEGIEKEK